MRKRILSGILTVCMVLSFLPMAASAANTTGDRDSALSFSPGINSIITKTGDLYVYGDLVSGNKPQIVLKNVKKAETSYFSASIAAIKENGDLYVWEPTFDNLNESTGELGTAKKILSHVTDVCYTGRHSGAITEDGSLYMWGYNDHGQVGIGTTKNQNQLIKVLSDVASVSLSNTQSAAITKDGSLYMWGSNDYGEVGNGSTQDQLRPTKILSNVVHIHLGGANSAAVTKNGDLYMWGFNYQGQIGNGSTQNQLRPTKILSNVAYVHLGGAHSAAITKTGDLYMWGDNSFGQIGNGSTQNQLRPTKILSNVAYVDLGGAHSAAITKTGDLYMWGINSYGQIGNGTTKDQLVPLKIMNNVVDVCCDELVGAVKSNGDLYTWGSASELYFDEYISLKPKKTLSNVRLPSESNDDETNSPKLSFIDANDIVHATAVGRCVELNIISGFPDGSYKPSGNITRAQMCKMICTALNGGKDPATSIKTTPSFTDIDSNWAEGYIEYCYAKGIVSGIGNGKFNPNGNVTGTQAAKMLLVSLGYNAETQNYIGSNWSANVNAQASKDGLYNMLSNINYEYALSRDNAAQMIWNTLQANVVNSDGSSKGYSLLQKSYGISP